MLQNPYRFQQVVKRSVRYGDADDAEHPDLRAIYRMWNEARGARAMPVRGDISARALKEYLYKVQLYDVVDGGAEFRCRVSGADVFLVNGIDMTGKSVSQHPNSGVRERLTETLKRVVSAGKPVYARFESVEAIPVHHDVVESIYMPLGAGPEVAQILGLTVFPAER